jgi:D-alanyl-D-alanine carboxypeptidase
VTVATVAWQDHAMFETRVSSAGRLRRPSFVVLVLTLATLVVGGAMIPGSTVALGSAPVTNGAFTAAFAPSVRFSPQLTDRLTATLARLRAVYHLPGLQAAIRYPDGTGWQGHAGFGDLAAHQAMGNLTLLDAGSITKTFVAALTLQLASQGVLSLDDPVSRWLPDLPYDPGLTIRELLDHTSGINDPFNQPALLDALDRHHRTPWTPARVLAYRGRTLFAPGTGYAYSNGDYILLGEVLERATGSTLADLLRARYFAPLHLTHTFLQSEEPVHGLAAHGYDYTGSATGAVKDLSDGTSYLPYTSLATALGAAGALVSTSDDLARWALYLYRGRVLAPPALQQMLDFSLTSAFHPPLPYGLGVERRSLLGFGSWGHGGALSGFRAAMRYFPDAGGVSIVVMTNSDRVNPDLLVQALLGVLYPARA